MKKLIFSVVAALCCSTICAQQLSESFEDAQFPPEGWTAIADHNYPSYSSWARSTSNPYDGSACAFVNPLAGASNYLITPQLRPAAGEKLIFYARVSEYAKGAELQVLLSVNGNNPAEFTDTLGALSTSQTAADPRLFKEWQAYQLPLEDYVGQRIFIAFHHYDKSSAEKIFLDKVYGVTLAGSATCESPYNLAASNITAEKATISWEGETAEYSYVLALHGEAADWSEAAAVTGKQVELTGLDENTSYDFYVRAYCSAEEQSLAPKVTFKTTCEANSIPWLETFSRHETGAVEPDCWTVSSPEVHQVWVVSAKEYDDEGNATIIPYSGHLYAAGGGTTTAQVFAMPTFDARLDTLELAFDYHTNMVSESYGVPEIGYMTNPADAKTFVSLKQLDQTLEYVHVVYPLNELPDDVRFLAFRFAGGTSNYGGLYMDNFILAAIGHSQEINPEDEELPDASIYGLSYCEAQFTWYAYSVEAFAIGLFESTTQTLVAGIAVTTGECDRFAYQDGVTFSQDDDYENHYYCSTKWILNVDEEGLAKGDAWSSCVRNIGTAATPLLGLKAGKYQVQILKYDTNTGTTTPIQTIPFELTEKVVANLKAEVAADKKTATLTWEQPALATGERLYVRVWAGETIAFDNFDDKKNVAVSPLTVQVEDGKAYAAIVQIIDKNRDPLGPEVQCDFTVGVNNYEPKNPHAEVFGGDNVTFTWEVEQTADFYDIVLYADGDYYTTLSVHSTTKTTTMPKDATWSWTVQPFTQGTTGKYFAASNPVAGNDFVSKGAEVPEDAVVMDVWGMEAAYLDEASGYYQEGKHGWIITFATGEDGSAGYPMPWFLIYTNKHYAISGVYNVARENIDLESCLLNTTGYPAGFVMAKDAEVRLQFDGYDEDKFAQGYAYGYYTGSFRLAGEDGKTYIGKFMELFCNSFNYSTYGNVYRDHVGMWEEDSDEPFDPEDGVEQVLTEQGFDLSRPMYNIMGRQVDASYKGIVIQDGKKFMLQ